ncbi:MAG: hypothetical protein GC138_09665 [Gammaproteobacteria bacterium]|nr:hypothetical protein [Gammaproteobacteria bacterium]
MKILYGVQATGNGHITRARTMAPVLAAADIEVDYLFSGRRREELFSMDPFGDFRCLPGLTFAIKAGRIQYLKTAMNNSITGFIRDVRTLDLSPYDLVLTDFEPVTAWSARLQKKPSIAIGHQYAFFHDIPKAKNNPLASAIIRYFAPAETQIGLHWDHFDSPILPPMIERPRFAPTLEKGCVLIYLPFEDTNEVINFLKPFSDYRFWVYCATDEPKEIGSITLKPFSRETFQQDLACCEGVISNSGFELASEALQYGKKILVKPLKGQMEQWSNAAALTRLGIGMQMNDFDPAIVASWMKLSSPKPLLYPDVAATLTNWIQTGRTDSVDTLSRLLWADLSPRFDPDADLLASAE